MITMKTSEICSEVFLFYPKLIILRIQFIQEKER